MSGEPSQRSIGNGEEYEWAGVVKLRTTYEEAKALAGSGLVVVSKNDDDEVIDVERRSDFGDDQYSESDLQMDSDDSDATVTCMKSSQNEFNTDQPVGSNKNNLKTSIICSICLDNLHKPVVSTACWHIYCERCWIRCLRTKKLCPKCNVIVLPSHLRKVYF